MARIRVPQILLALALSAALALPAVAAEPPTAVLDSSRFQPIASSARTVAELVREAAWRRVTSRGGPVTADGEPSGAGVHARGGALRSEASASLTPDPATGEEKGAGYFWQVEQSWLPGYRGIQWCVSGFQTVEPLGGVKLYLLPGDQTEPRSLRRQTLVVTLLAQEQIPGPDPTAKPNRPGMVHEFDYGTCVLPELTRVGTYQSAVSFCGSRDECANRPHVLPVTLELEPFLWSFDVCLDRRSGVVEVFHAALFFDQRPAPASVQVLLDGSPRPDATVTTGWPWIFVEYQIPLAEYDRRFGRSGEAVSVELPSESRYTPTARMYFDRSEWLRPCQD